MYKNEFEVTITLISSFLFVDIDCSEYNSGGGCDNASGKAGIEVAGKIKMYSIPEYGSRTFSNLT